MRIVRPVFMIGAGRSGSTVTFEMLARHADVYWLSNLCERNPSRLIDNKALMAAIDVPLVRKVLGSRVRPSEAWRFWEAYCPGFSEPKRDLVAEDVSDLTRQQITHAIARMSTRRRRRFVAKLTGWPRISYLSAIFNDALFIHLVRDGRAVASSLLHVPWWRGRQGPDHWRWGRLSEEHQSLWERHGRSDIALAALQWVILTDATEEARRYVSEDRFLEIRYEDMVASPADGMRRIASFCALSWTPAFERSIHNLRMVSSNHKWRESLTALERQQVEDIQAPTLRRFGYQLENVIGDVGR